MTCNDFKTNNTGIEATTLSITSENVRIDNYAKYRLHEALGDMDGRFES